MADGAAVSNTYGVHSEVGKLRKVLVCAPGLAHKRLTPTNCDDLLFDDVMWVQNAQARPLRLHDQDARARRRGGRAAQRPRRDDGRSPRPRRGCWTARSSPTRSVSGSSTDTRGLPRRAGSRGRWPGILIGGLSTDDLPTDLRSATSAGRERSGGRATT